MALRKNHCYTPIKRAFTRKSKVKSKSYIKTIPPRKLAKFIMGDIPGYHNKKYKYQVSMIMNKDIQIRDNSIEASRQLVHRQLEDGAKGNYCLFVSVYPHHILRENKMITGAGADRMQTGMAHSFGQPVGVAAQIFAGNALFTIYCQKEAIILVRKALNEARTKLPGDKSIVVKEINREVKKEIK
jgi:large subunit ribosomal protein L10e